MISDKSRHYLPFFPFIYLQDEDVSVNDHRSESTLISVCHNTMGLFSSTASCWDCRFPTVYWFFATEWHTSRHTDKVKTQIHTLAYERLAYKSHRRFSFQSCSSSRVIYSASYIEILFLIGSCVGECEGGDAGIWVAIFTPNYANVLWWCHVSWADGALSLK